jgi:hypothetical protein
MAFKLALSVYTSGLESQSAQVLSALKLFATLTPPITEADMRTELETGQFQAFSDEGWDNFLTVVAQTPLDTTALTAAERAIINEIYGAVNISPQNTDGLTSITPYYVSGSTTVPVDITLDNSLTCDINTIEVTITGVPAVTSTNPHVFTFNGCVSGNMTYTYPDVTFASDPSGISYNLAYVFKDADGVTIASYTVTDYTMDIPPI